MPNKHSSFSFLDREANEETPLINKLGFPSKIVVYYGQNKYIELDYIFSDLSSDQSDTNCIVKESFESIEIVPGTCRRSKSYSTCEINLAAPNFDFPERYQTGGGCDFHSNQRKGNTGYRNAPQHSSNTPNNSPDPGIEDSSSDNKSV